MRHPFGKMAIIAVWLMIMYRNLLQTDDDDCDQPAAAAAVKDTHTGTSRRIIRKRPNIRNQQGCEQAENIAMDRGTYVSEEESNHGVIVVTNTTCVTVRRKLL